ncbi:hypothetical protein UPYG_G00333990 [Umbra pygmaea]|uniref:Uncharacterized protein n=1 Tax=Umbra pygmaea TaxID=75934 RepID=A0ABD0VWH5_UMBPY
MSSGSSSCQSSSSCVRWWVTPAPRRQRPSHPKPRVSAPLLRPRARGPRWPGRGLLLLTAPHRQIFTCPLSPTSVLVPERGVCALEKPKCSFIEIERIECVWNMEL